MRRQVSEQNGRFGFPVHAARVPQLGHVTPGARGVGSRSLAADMGESSCIVVLESYWPATKGVNSRTFAITGRGIALTPLDASRKVARGRWRAFSSDGRSATDFLWNQEPASE